MNSVLPRKFCPPPLAPQLDTSLIIDKNKKPGVKAACLVKVAGMVRNSEWLMLTISIALASATADG